MNAGVLLLGARRGALTAAERMGLEVWVAAARLPVGTRARELVRPADPGPAALLDAGRSLLRRSGSGIRAVAALTEAAVVPAARLREEFGLPGLSCASALCCTDKRRMKAAADAAGIPVTPWRAVDGTADPGALVEELGLPLVLKLARSSGSRGQVVATDLEQVRAALPQAELVERFVHGREMSIESLVAGGELAFTNPTEYLVPLHASIVAAPPAAADWRAALELSSRVLRAFDFERGMAHLELYQTPQGTLLGEVAARPPGGRLMPLLRHAYGFDPWESMLHLELGHAIAPPRGPLRCVGAWMLHPGAGTVRALEGLEAARAVPGIRRVVVRVRPGERIEPRLGSGQDIGFLEAEGPSRDAVAAALLEAHGLLRIELG